MTLSRAQGREYRTLRDSGVNVRKRNQIRFNAGGASETAHHATAKTLVGLLGLRNGYRVDSEVEVESGEIDVLLWGHESRLTYAVEVETSPTEQIKREKLAKYVYETAVDDMTLLNLSDAPLHSLELLEWCGEQVGLSP